MKCTKLLRIIDFFLPIVGGEFTQGELERLRKLIGLSFALLLIRVPYLLFNTDRPLPDIFRVISLLLMLGVAINPFLIKYYNLRRLAEILFTAEWFLSSLITATWASVSVSTIIGLITLTTMPQFIFLFSHYCGYCCSGLVFIAVICLYAFIDSLDHEPNATIGLNIISLFYVFVSCTISMWYCRHTTIHLEETMLRTNPTSLSEIKTLVIEKNKYRSVIFTNVSIIVSAGISGYFNPETRISFLFVIVFSAVIIVVVWNNVKYLLFCSQLSIVSAVASLFCCGSSGMEFHIGYSFFSRSSISFAFFIGGKDTGIIVLIITNISLLLFKSHFIGIVPVSMHLFLVFALGYLQEESLENSRCLFKSAMAHMERVNKDKENCNWDIWLKHTKIN